MNLIPTTDAPFYDIKTTLDGSDFVLSFRYATREDRWYFDVATADGTPIAQGVKIVTGAALLRRVRSPLWTGGVFLAVPSDGAPPGRGELGEGARVGLYYLSPTDFP